MSTTYAEFLERKAHVAPNTDVEPGPTHDSLYPFQDAVVRWAILRGRAAIFADCGLGKTRMQLEWSRQMGQRVLIVAPLAVAEQTIAEGTEIGVPVRYVTAPDNEVGIAITNYERLHHFVGVPYDAIVLDESSILKSIDGKTRTLLLRKFTSIPHRLCCTATPAPNDISELANHAEFLGIMTRVEMLATFFVHDGSKDEGQNGWRLKGHAADAFWLWMVKWALYIRMPSDIGFDDGPFTLPPLTIQEDIVDTDYVPDGALFPGMTGGIQGRTSARRATLEERVARLADQIGEPSEPILVWHGLNDEGRALRDRLNGRAVLIEGQDSDDARLEKHRRWLTGAVPVLITKPSIFGFGMNWQHCARVYFLGLGDSYEAYYQAIRRCWRFGQKRPVTVTIVTSEAEDLVLRNVMAKEANAKSLSDGIVSAMKELETLEVQGAMTETETYTIDEARGAGWELWLGDSAERLKDVGEGTVGLSVFSPPFASLYTYTASPRDLGNCKDYDTFFEQFRFIIAELLRVTMTGRRVCCHVQQVTTTKAIHGVIGWRDFRADTVRAFQDAGFIYDGEVVIDKDPQAQAIRTKSKALMFVQKNKDSAWCRPAMADYILLFRKPGDNPQPVKTDVTNEEWISWARPVWYGIRETNTLNAAEGRAEKDEKHICPLQLETIARCIRLWSNEGDLVLSPFAGIGSEGYEAIRHGRRFIGIELKKEYWEAACRNLQRAESQCHGGLFEGAR